MTYISYKPIPACIIFIIPSILYLIYSVLLSCSFNIIYTQVTIIIIIKKKKKLLKYLNTIILYNYTIIAGIISQNGYKIIL